MAFTFEYNDQLQYINCINVLYVLIIETNFSY